MTARAVTVFGGTGFLGRRVVARLRAQGAAVRCASRRPEAARRLFGPDDAQFQAIQADVHDERSVAAALSGAWAAVNAVSLYVERGGETFQAVHVDAARRMAAAARRTGLARLAHLSGIGSDPGSPSRYVRKRGEGEQAVAAAFPGATVIRPAVMFGPDDAFLRPLLRLLRLPAFPMFGDGRTRLQPVHVEDVGEAIARALLRPEPAPAVFEFGGPQVYAFATLLRTVAREAGLRPALVPVPFPVWRAAARSAERLPRPPLTLNQVELMQIDTVAAPDKPGLAALGVAPHPLEAAVRAMAGRPRPSTSSG